jgi:hypothetical protein
MMQEGLSPASEPLFLLSIMISAALARVGACAAAIVAIEGMMHRSIDP